MKAGERLDLVTAVLEDNTAVRLDILQLVQGLEVPIDEWRVGERPEAFGRLDFGRVGWQKRQVDMRRNGQMSAGMPAGAVEHQDDLAVRPRPGVFGKVGQFEAEHVGVDGGGGVPDRPPRLGMNKADQVTPLIARLYGDDRALTGQRPDRAQDRLQTDAVFVGCPNLDLGLGMRGLHCLHGFR